MTSRSTPVDGFSLEYDDHTPPDDRVAHGDPVVCLHGWPGDRTDYDAMVPMLSDRRVVVPDLRGFGGSDKHPADPATMYSAAAQASSVASLLAELGIDRVVVAGYDVGSRVGQQLAADHPHLVRALVIPPPLPGAGRRVLEPEAAQEFWYQSFHQLELSERLVDGRPDAVRHYLEHFWTHWSGPDFTPDPAHLDALTEHYAQPGGFVASIAWYRAGGGTLARSAAETAPAAADRLSTATHVLWPSHDPLFPREWSDRVEEFLADVTVEPVDGVGHFAPVEFPGAFARAVLAA